MVDLEAIQSFGEALKKNLQCAICLSLLKNPASGDCLHKFCRKCIDQQIAIRKKPKCPICNKPLSRRSLRETGHLKTLLHGVESLLTSINSDGAEDGGSDEPVVPFSQFELTTCESPVKESNATATVCNIQANQQSTTNCETPAAKSSRSIVAKTPARKWGVEEKSSSRKRKKSTLTAGEDQVKDTNKMLLETIEKGNLGEKRMSKKCSRKDAADVSNAPLKDVPVKELSDISSKVFEQTEANYICTIQPKNLVQIKVPSSNSSSLLNSEDAIAAKNRALQRLLKNARHVEESGRITNTSFNSTTYQSPKPSSAVTKKVSPFVLKNVNKSSPSPDTTGFLNNRPGQVQTTKTNIESDEDSLEIGAKKKATALLKISSSEEDSNSTGNSTCSRNSKRKSLRRKAAKPPIIEDDDDDNYIVPGNLTDIKDDHDHDEPNTVDVLEISFGLRGPEEVFKESISIKNTESKSKPCENIDIIKIGKGTLKSKKTCPTDIESSGKSVELLEKPIIGSPEDLDEYLPSCGLESELSSPCLPLDCKESTDKNKQHLQELPKPNLSTITDEPSLKEKLYLRKIALSRQKGDHPKDLDMVGHSESPTAPVTPLLNEVIKSSNTVLETPLIPAHRKPPVDKVVETPIAHEQFKESKKRSIEYGTSNEESIQNSAEKRARHDDSSLKYDHTKSYVFDQKDSSDVLEDPPRLEEKHKTKIKEFLNKISVTQKRNDGTTPRKNVVVEKIYSKPNKDKTSPKLTIDKDGNRTNYTIEKENPAGKLTIIQEGPIMSPKLMKHIYEDFLQSDPNSCDDLINSITADKESSLNCDSVTTPGPLDVDKPSSLTEAQSNSLNVDHQALIFGQDSVENSTSEGKNESAEKIQHKTEIEPDSLEGFTYNNPPFNEADFKKTFGIVPDSSSVDNCDVVVFQENPNACDQGYVKDSQPTLADDENETKEKSKGNNLDEALVFDTVPHKDMESLADLDKNVTTVAESIPEVESQTKLHQPLTSSTQHSKETTSPTTPAHTLVSSSGHVYTSQERILIEQQLRETEAALLRLQEIEQAGVAVADTLQPELPVRQASPAERDAKVNETVYVNEQESFTQEELFDDNASTNSNSVGKNHKNASQDDDVTVCEAELSSLNRNTDNREGNRRGSSSQKDNNITESVDQDVCEINTAELIALNEAAIEGRRLPDPKSRGFERKCRVDCARGSGQESVGSTLTPITQTDTVSEKPGSGKKSEFHVEKETAQRSKDKDSNKVSDNRISEKEKCAISTGEDKEKNKENCLPLPNIVQLQSASSSHLPSTQETSPVITSRRSSLTAEPVKKVNLLLSGMLGKEGSKEAFKLRKSIRGNSKVQFRVLTQYTEAVTHLIFPHNDSMTCPRTTKYFMGIAGGKWILSNQWLVQSYQCKELLNEAPYEMQGDLEGGRTHAPRAARMARALKYPLLFADTSVYYVGEIRIMPRDQFSSLLESVGVTIVRPPEIGASTPASLMSYKTQTKIKPLIDSDVTDINKARDETGIEPITAQWVIECIAAFRVLPPEAISR
ncbi:hypothetical protein ACHWQZ_G019259 [Mnemiopsis leidyi]